MLGIIFVIILLDYSYWSYWSLPVRMGEHGRRADEYSSRGCTLNNPGCYLQGRTLWAYALYNQSSSILDLDALLQFLSWTLCRKFF